MLSSFLFFFSLPKKTSAASAWTKPIPKLTPGSAGATIRASDLILVPRNKTAETTGAAFEAGGGGGGGEGEEEEEEPPSLAAAAAAFSAVAALSAASAASPSSLLCRAPPTLRAATESVRTAKGAMTTPAAASVAAADGRGVPPSGEERGESRQGLSEASSGPGSPPEEEGADPEEEGEEAAPEEEGEEAAGPQASGAPPGQSARPRYRARPLVAGPGSEQGSYLPRRTAGGVWEKSSEEALLLFKAGFGRGSGGGGGGGGVEGVSRGIASQSLEE